MSDLFLCGSSPDLEILKNNLFSMLFAQENVLVDNEYTHTKFVTMDDVRFGQEKAYTRMRARYEGCNGRLKYFSILSDTDRHKITLHGLSFHVVLPNWLPR